MTSKSIFDLSRKGKGKNARFVKGLSYWSSGDLPNLFTLHQTGLVTLTHKPEPILAVPNYPRTTRSSSGTGSILLRALFLRHAITIFTGPEKT